MNELEAKLNELSLIWQEKDRTEAEEYYKNELMPILIEYFLKVNKVEEKCDFLILTLGTSYEPLVFSILSLKPDKVFILYTDKTLPLLDNVIEFTKLKPSQYTTSKIDAENPLELYWEIKNIYEKWGRPENIYVDFTSGTKSMSAGCAMAGVTINARLTYVGGEYIKTLGKPKPGSERLCFIEDPYTVFGDLERDQAILLFNSMDYISAYRIFDELEQRVPGFIKEYSALKCLSKAYDAWDSLNIKEAIANLEECIKITRKELKLSKNFILSKHEDKLKCQLEVLKVLQIIHSNDNTHAHKAEIFNNIGYLIANLYQNANRREKQGKYEMASLLLYRILEIVEQKRLWNYGIDTSNADYCKLPVDETSLHNKINNIIRKIYDSNKLSQLDNKISLLNGFILLVALEDDIIKARIPGKEINELNRLRSKVEARNKSIFAHGFEFIDSKKYYDFKEVVVEYINKLGQLEGINMDELFSICEFIVL